MLEREHVSSAYRKAQTCRQQHAALNGGMTYSRPARRKARGIRVRRTRVAALLAVVAAIAAVGYRLSALASSTTASVTDVVRRAHGDELRETLSGNVWPGDGQAAFMVA